MYIICYAGFVFCLRVYVLVEGDQCSKKKLGKISCTFFAQKQTKSLSGEEMCAYESFLLCVWANFFNFRLSFNKQV